MRHNLYILCRCIFVSEFPDGFSGAAICKLLSEASEKADASAFCILFVFGACTHRSDLDGKYMVLYAGGAFCAEYCNGNLGIRLSRKEIFSGKLGFFLFCGDFVRRNLSVAGVTVHTFFGVCGDGGCDSAFGISSPCPVKNEKAQRESYLSG